MTARKSNMVFLLKAVNFFIFTVGRKSTSVPVPLLSRSGAKSFIVTFGSIHCIQRLTRPLDPPMVLVVCSKVTESENGDSSPACTESPCGEEEQQETRNCFCSPKIGKTKLKFKIVMFNFSKLNILTM